MVEGVYVGVGSNVGDRANWITQAVTLFQTNEVRILRASSIYESAPLGPIQAQGNFYNAVLEVATTLSPVELLRHCLATEEQLGRVRHQPQGPRNIDLDIVLFGNRVLAGPPLDLPHPRYRERAFVLCPLLELNETLIDPVEHVLVRTYLAQIQTEQTVKRIGPLTLSG